MKLVRMKFGELHKNGNSIQLINKLIHVANRSAMYFICTQTMNTQRILRKEEKSVRESASTAGGQMFSQIDFYIGISDFFFIIFWENFLHDFPKIFKIAN